MRKSTRKLISALFAFSFAFGLIVVCFIAESKKVQQNARKQQINALKDDFENADSIEIINSPF
jgi:acid phosphatase family membrane protein YuiD